MTKATEQPKPVEINIPIMDHSVMYSMLGMKDLYTLRDFLNDLIAWKAAGNPVEIMTLEYEVKENDSN